MAASDDALDAVVRDQVALTRLEAAEMKKVRAALKRLEGELVAKIAKIDPTGPSANSFRTKRMKKLLEESRLLIRDAYQDLSKAAIERNARAALASSRMVVDSINKKMGIDIMRTTLPPAQARRIGRQTLIEGATSRKWWNEQSVALQQRFEKTMQNGLVANEDLQSLTQRVRGTREFGFTNGIMSATTNQAQSLIRTSIAAVSNAARVETFKENDDVVKGIQWVAVLDSRTTEICMALDGLTWDLDGNPIDHDQPYPGPTAHFNERSTQVPVLKSFEELTGKGGNKQLAREIDRAFSEDRKRATFNGQVAEKTNYESWLRRQPKAVQVEALGAGRRQLWIDGKISFSDMIDQRNRPLTFDQLERKYG